MGVENFRPNIVVKGGSCQPHQEDNWKSLTLVFDSVHNTQSDLMLKVTKPCARCCMVNVMGTASGAIDNRILDTIGSYRRKGSSINFGQFLSYISMEPFTLGETAVLPVINENVCLFVGMDVIPV